MDELLELGFTALDDSTYSYGSIIITVQDDDYIYNGQSVTLEDIEDMICNC